MDSTSKPSQPKKKKVVKDISDMTEEEQLHAAMLASMGGDPSSAIDLSGEGQETPASSTSEPEGKHMHACMMLYKAIGSLDLGHRVI